MYDLEYVKKRKRKKAAIIVVGISTIVVSALAITSFLGRFVGTFTVSLDTGNVQITLSESSSFKNPTSYLRINDLPRFEEYTFDNLPSDDVLDNEEIAYLDDNAINKDGEDIVSMDYFKYTFFVKNVGNKHARYNLDVNIVDNKPSKDGRYLDDTLRVMIYETDLATSFTTKEVYAKKTKTPHYNDEGELEFTESISISKEYASTSMPFRGYANTFDSSSRITTIPVVNFGKGSIRRYTIVAWLEGYDPEAYSPIDEVIIEAPKDARLKLGVEINAYEN